MSRITFTILLPLLLLAISCQTFEVEITSIPEGADVEVFNPSISSYEKKGVTPMKVEESQLLSYAPDSSNLTAILVSKPGYALERILIDKSGNPKVTMHVNLKALKSWSNGDDMDSVMANTIASDVQTIYQHIESKSYAKALQSADDLIARYSKAYFFWDIKGSVLYLMGEKAEAIRSYRKSLALFPDNPETKLILESLER